MDSYSPNDPHIYWGINLWCIGKQPKTVMTCNQEFLLDTNQTAVNQQLTPFSLQHPTSCLPILLKSHLTLAHTTDII